MSGTPEYVIELRKGQQEVVRSHRVDTVEDALGLIDGLRDSYAQRANVNWAGDEVDVAGNLPGTGPEGEFYLITVSPPLAEASERG